MKLLRPLFGPVVLTAALTLVAMPAFAAPTVSTIGGDTRVELSSTFLSALTSLNVTPSPSFPARISGANASFPIPTGEIDLANAKGEIVHSGGLNLTAGDLTVNLSSFVIDTSGDAPVLTGLVKANDSLVGRITLFDLQLGEAPKAEQAKQTDKGRLFGTIRIDNVAVTLSAEAAAALNDAFGVTAFQGGIPIGTARVRTGYYEPDFFR